MIVGWLLACGPQFAEEELAGTRHLFTRLTSNVKGTATIKLPLYDQETAFLATAQADPPNAVHFRTLRDGNDQAVFEAFRWNDVPYSKTNGGFVADTVSLNWPTNPDDPNLFPGKWEIELGVVDSAKNYVSAPIQLDVMVKDDPTFDDGALDVSIVYTDGLEDDQVLWDAVEEAKDQWIALYAKMGIDVRYHTYAYAESGLAPPAFGGESAYVAIASDTEPRSINLVVSGEIAGYDDIYGIAGDIPGPLVPTTRSGVQVSAALAAGQDLEFSSEEIRLLAETMAHEVGHFCGLFHPVESSWAAWDVLADTRECSSEDECTDDLGTNLMFPFPVCQGATCTPQDELTEEQAGTANRYTGIW